MVTSRSNPANNEVRNGSNSPREGQTQVKCTQKSTLSGDSKVNCFTQAFWGQGDGTVLARSVMRGVKDFSVTASVVCRAADCGKIGISSRPVATSPEAGLFYSVECAIRELIPPKVDAH